MKIKLLTSVKESYGSQFDPFDYSSRKLITLEHQECLGGEVSLTNPVDHDGDTRYAKFECQVCGVCVHVLKTDLIIELRKMIIGKGDESSRIYLRSYWENDAADIVHFLSNDV